MKTHCITFALLILPLVAWSQFGQVREAEIPESLAAKIYTPQQRPATCWAACNSMLLAAEGIKSSEEDQIRRMAKIIPSGGLFGAGDNFRFARQALEGKYGNRNVRAWYRDRRDSNDPDMNRKFVKLIQEGKPAIVATPGNQGHGMVAIGVRFEVLPNGFYRLSGIKVLDPNPLAQRVRWLPMTEFLSVFGFMAIEAEEEEDTEDETERGN